VREVLEIETFSRLQTLFLDGDKALFVMGSRMRRGVVGG
jgi:hypothetical protein